MTFHRVGAGLTGVVARWIDDPELRWRLVCRAWEVAAGEVVARHAVPVALQETTLHVRIDAPVWRHTLTDMRSELLTQLQRELGPDLVRQIAWQDEATGKQPR